MKLATRMATGVGAALAVAGLIGGAGLADAAIKANNHTASGSVSGDRITVTVKNTSASTGYCSASAMAGNLEKETDLILDWNRNGDHEQPAPDDVVAAKDKIVKADTTGSGEQPTQVPAGQTGNLALATPGTGSTFTIMTSCVTDALGNNPQVELSTFVLTRSGGGNTGGGDSGSLGGGLGSLSGLF
ncbi:hypothetical protein MUG78_13625 [Gordonia alkaliphila]|uniref:hypothetical protein n=1 Tax=Gordonia alkaliphila TaxID=1053547 RepID=UPI001FF4DCEB|nr:hypothetical protein [Gordonia alkaliphila]MCK0440466.1 hypothetical protein [Gordonia alkaliphila]